MENVSLQRIIYWGIVFSASLMLQCSTEPSNATTQIPNPSKSPDIDTSEQVVQEFTDFEAYGIPLQADKNISYTTIKSSIANQRKELAKKHISKDSLANIFEDNLLQKIIPYWYGTAWSFEGHSNIPKKGEIACGYFVSTTLKHLGLPLNRYKLAQQSPINEAKTLGIQEEVTEVNNAHSTENIKALKALTKEGIYFIGFAESHVGFLLKRKGALFLIHSNYLNASGVCIEKIDQSEVFRAFQKFYIVSLSHNTALLDKWMQQENIKIVTKG